MLDARRSGGKNQNNALLKALHAPALSPVHCQKSTLVYPGFPSICRDRVR